MGLFKKHNGAHVDVDIERQSAEIVGRLNQLALELETILLEVEEEQDES